MSTLYNDFLPLIRLLKISVIGVGDFAIGLTLAVVLDQAFSQLSQYELRMAPVPPPLTSTEKAEQKAADTLLYYYPTLTRGDVTVQNPLGAPQPVLDGTQMKMIGLVTLAQLMVTLVAGLELRNIFIPYQGDFFDPTGGIVFVLALLQQPGLWGRAVLLLQNLYRGIWWLEQPTNTVVHQS